MCQQVTHYHPCHHSSFGPLYPCNFPRHQGNGHFISTLPFNLPTPCPSCASRPYYPPLPPPGSSYAPYLPPVPRQMLFYPTQQILYQQPPPPYYPHLPPGSYGTPLPIPVGTGTSTQLERVGNHLEAVTHYHFPPHINTPFPPFISANAAQAGSKTGGDTEKGYDIGSLPKDWNPNLGHWRETPAAVPAPAEEQFVPSPTPASLEVAEESVMSGGIPFAPPATANTASEPVVEGDVQTHGPTLKARTIPSEETAEIQGRGEEQEQKLEPAPANNAQPGVDAPSADESSGPASVPAHANYRQPSVSEPLEDESSGQASSSEGLNTHTPGSSGQTTPTSAGKGSTDIQDGPESEDKEVGKN